MIISQFNEKGAGLEKIKDGLYRTGDKSVSIRLNPEAKN
jgi:hypothetical protein